MERVIPDPGFADDDGAGDAGVLAALQAHRNGDAAVAEVLAALEGARVLVPVVAVLGEVEYDEAGLAHDKTSDMAAVLMERADGRRALLAFTGTSSMQAWDPEARPVPVTVAKAATAAVQEQADALVIDVAGPASFVIDGDTLQRVAAGWRVARMEGEYVWIGSSES